VTGEATPLQRKAERVIKVLWRDPELCFAVAMLIKTRLVSPWRGPVINGNPPHTPTQMWYARYNGTTNEWKRVLVTESVDRRESGEPHWGYRVFKGGLGFVPEIHGYATTRDEAFKLCDDHLLEHGFCVPCTDYTEVPYERT